MILFRCDRCGKVFDKKRYEKTIVIGGRLNGSKNPVPFDLCDNCQGELEDWVYAEKTSEVGA